MPGRLNAGILEHTRDVTFSYTITTAQGSNQKDH